MSATTMHTSDAREFNDGRALAGQRTAMRLTLAEALQRVIPPLVTVVDEYDVDLLPCEAQDAASDLIDELERMGYVITREPRS